MVKRNSTEYIRGKNTFSPRKMACFYTAFYITVKEHSLPLDQRSFSLIFIIFNHIMSGILLFVMHAAV